MNDAVMVIDDQDRSIPALLRLPPMISLTAFAEAREGYLAQFGTLPDEKRLECHGIRHRVELLNLACECGIALEELPEVSGSWCDSALRDVDEFDCRMGDRTHDHMVTVRVRFKNSRIRTRIASCSGVSFTSTGGAGGLEFGASERFG